MKRIKHIAGALSAILLLGHTHAKAENIDPNTLPKDPNVVNGDATISSSTNKLDIEQKTGKLCINWSSFNIGKEASVEFFQPSNNSVAVNRVNSSDPSYIYGDLKANGQLIFINPSGVLFKGGSKVDVGSMIATTLNMNDDYFFNNDKYVFKDNNSIGKVVNAGNISAQKGGTIALIARNVENKGEINTPDGSTALISGESVILTMTDNTLVNFEINESELDKLIKEKNAISTTDNEVFLTNKGKNDVLSAVINNEGTIKANSITKKAGRIFLSSKKGKIKNSGTMMANSSKLEGGYIEITADKIEINKRSSIQAKGDTDGGKVLVGGSWQNSDSKVYQAKSTVIEENAEIDASSVNYGKGGEIVVWSDIHNKEGKTLVNGALYAKGGENSGSGGRIETSGHSLEIDNIKVSTKSVDGRDGEWLLDPYNIEIIGSGSGADYTANEDDEQISASTLVTALASSNITVRTDGGGSQDGDIRVSSAISSSSGNDLTLDADNDIIINASITRAGSGGLVLTTGSGSVSGSGTISLGGGSSISSSSGANVENNISLTSGDATFNQSGTAEYSGVISGSGNFIKSGSGTVTLSGSNSYTGDTTISAGILTLSGTLSDSTDVIVNSGTTYDVNTNDTIQSLTGAGTIDIASARTLTAGGDNGSENISGNFTGSGNFLKQGTGTYTFQGASNSISGLFTSSEGEIVFKGTFSGSPHLRNNATFTLDNDVTFASVEGSGAFSIPDTLTLTTGDNGNNAITGTLSGNGTLVKQGNGTLTLSGTNSSFTGAININAGTIAVSDSANLGSTPGSAETDIVLNGGALRATAAFTLGTNKSISLTNNSTINVDTDDILTYGGVISGSYGLTKSGAGTLVLTGNNSYTGSATLSAGTLQVASDANISGSPGSTDADNIIFSGGTLNNTSGFTLDSNRGITTNSTGTINTESSTTLSYGGVVTGVGAITKSGDGTLSLSGANTYTGDTTISAGKLTVSGTLSDSTDVINSATYDVDTTDTIQSLSGTGAVELANGITLTTGDSNNHTLSGVISGAGALTKAGAGTFTLSGSNTYSGSTTLSAGTIAISASANIGATPGSADADNIIFNGGTLNTTGTFSLGANKGITLTGNGTINTNSATELTYSGVVTGSANLTKSGAGTLILGGTNTYSGTTTISGGKISISADNNLGQAPASATTGSLVLNGGSLLSTSSITLDSDRGVSLGASGGTIENASTTTLTYGGIIADSGALTKTGAGTLLLSGANTYSGDTTISAGTLTVSGTLADTTDVINSGTYDVDASDTIQSLSGSGAVELANGISLTTGDSNNHTVSGIISGAGAFIKAGSGTLTVSGNNTYTGDTTISAGKLTVSGTLADTTDVINSGTYDVDATDTIQSLSGSGAVELASGIILTTGDSGDDTISGVISGTGALTKAGSGTLTFSANNTYTGDTTISAGKLTVSGTLADTTDVINSGTYDVDATDTIQSLSGSGAVELANGITLTTGDSGDDTVSGVISGAGALAKAGSGTLTLSGLNTYTGSTTLSAGTIAISSSANIGATPGTVDADNIIFNGGTLNTTGTFSLGTNKGITMTGSGTINTDSSTTLTYGGVISDSGAITKSGSGTLLLSGANTYTGLTTISAGTLQVTGTLSDSAVINNQGTYDVDNSDTISRVYDTSGSSGNIELASGVTLTTGDSTDHYIYGVISGDGKITKQGTGSLYLENSNNTFTGGMSFNAGLTRLMDGDGNLGSVPGSFDADYLTFNGGGLYSFRTFTMNSNRGITLAGNGFIGSRNGRILTYGGVITGSGNLTKNYPGTLLLSGTNTYSGTTTIDEGILSVSSSANLGATPGSIDADNLILDGGTLRANSSFTLDNNKGITLNTVSTIQTDSSVTLTYGGIITGSVGYFKTGEGTLLLSGNNTYTGDTTISAGTLTVSGTLADTTDVINSGVYDVDATDTIQSLSGAGAVELASGIILTTGDGGDDTVSGVVSGAGALTKSGSGTLTFSANNTYTGDTTISAGTLKLTGTLADTTDVINSGTYDVDVTDTIQSLSGSGAVELASGITLTTGDSGDDTISGVISGTGSLEKTGSGTLTFSGSNTYTGDTTISAGTLKLTGTLADTTDVINSGVYDVDASDTIQSLSGSGAVELASGITLTTGDSGDDTISGVISGSGALTKAGSGTLTLSGSNTYTGSTTLSAGLISISATNNLGATPGTADADNLIFNGGGLNSTGTFSLAPNKGMTLSTSGTINTNASTTLTYGGIVTGSGNFIKDGSGSMVLSATNTYTGNTTISAGTLEVSGQLGSGSYSGTLANSGIFSYSSGSNQTLSGVISGSGSLEKSNSSTLTLSAANTYTGDTTISAGTLKLTGTLADTTDVINSGTYDVDATDTIQSLSGSGAVQLANGITLTTGDSGNDTVSGIVSGAGSLTKVGSGTLTFSANNTYTGDTTISAGTLTVSGTLADTTDIINSGTYDVDATDTIQSLSGSGAVELANGITLTTGDSGNDTVSGIISGAGSLEKTGSGTLTFSANNTYSGDTTISAGTLTVSGTLADTTDVINSGTYDVDATDTIQSLSGSGAVELANGITLTSGDSGNDAVSGVVSGAGSFEKAGSGTLTFSGNNTYTGDTTISAGTLKLTGTLADTTDVINSGTYDVDATDTIQSLSGSGAVELDNGITLTSGDSGNDTVSGVVSGTGSFEKAGSGTLTFSGNNTYTGDTTISAGTLTVSGTLADTTDVINSGTYDVDATDTIQSLSGSGAVELASGITLTTGDSGNDTVSGVISGAGALTKAGSGTLTFSTNNTYTGDTTISAGTLTVSGTLADTTDVINSGTYDVDATDTIQSLSGSGAVELASGITLTTGDSGNDTVSGIISGAGALTKAGSGTLTLSGSNTYSGSTTIGSGTIAISSSANLGATPGSADADNIIFNGGTLNTTGTFTLGSNKGITMTGNGSINTNSSTTLTYGGIATGSGALTKLGTGVIILSGNNTYTGDTTISAGTFRVSGTLSNNTDVINSGTYDVDATDTIQSLSGSGGVELANGITLTSGDSGNDTVSGVISGSGSFTKAGSGTLTFSATNTYTGDTTISAGTLTVSGTLADTTDVINSGTYDVDATDTIQSLSGSGSVQLADLITLTTGDSGNDTVSGVISGLGSLVKAGSGILTFSGANTYTGDTTISAGTLTVSGTLADTTDVINSGTYDVDATDTIQSLSGTGTTELASGITLTTGDSGDDTISGIISGAGSITKAGSGTLTFSATNTYTGDTAINAGKLTVSGTLADTTDVINSGTYDVDATDTIQSLSGSGAVELASAITLTTGDSGDDTVSGVISGAGALTKAGSGTLTFSANNTYTGDTTISAGTLKLTGTLADTTDVINSGTYDVDVTDTIQSLSGSGGVELANGITLTSGDSGDDTVSGVISGTGSFTKVGSGTLTFSATNTYTGDTTISAGTLTVSGTLADTTDVINSGTYDVDNSDTIQSLSGSGGVQLANGITLTSGDSGDDTVSGVISGAGSFAKAGSGTLILSANNTYTGDTTISAGTLTVSGTLADTTDVINSGTYDVDNSDTIQSLSGSGGVELANGIILTSGDAGNDTVSGVVSGAGALTKTGSGTLTFSANNTYTGDTTISAGTLKLTGTLADTTDVINSGTYDVDATDTIQSLSGSGAVELASGITLTTGDSGNDTVSGIISGAGSFTKAGSGTLTFSANNTYTGDTTISAGTLKLTGTLADTTDVINSGTYDVDATDTIQSLSGSGGVELANSITLTSGDSGDDTVSGVISGAGALTKVGSGTLTLSGSNTYSGSTTLAAGIISISSSANLGSTPVTVDADNIIFNGGTLNTTGTFTLGTNKGISLTGNGTLNTDSSTTLTYGGIISGSSNLTKSGAGTLLLTGSNTYTGSTTISAGTISISSSDNLGATPGSADADNLIFNGGTLNSSANFTLETNKGITLTGDGTVNTDSSTTVTYGGVITGSENLIKTGTGTFVLSGINTYTGNTTISAGTLTVSGTLSDSTDVINSGTYDVDATDTIQSLSGSGAVQLASSVTLTTGDSGNDTVSGVISGSGSFTKVGSGTLTFSTNNTYTGDTTISAGTLTVSGTLADTTDVINSGTYDVDATDTIQSLSGSGAVELANSITLTSGDSGSDTISGVISGSGSFSKSGSGTLTFSTNNTYTGDTTINAGTLKLTGTLSDSTDVINSGTYDVDATDTIQSLSGSGGVELANGITLTSGDSGNDTVSGIISGLGSFTKAGTGTLTFSANNAYTGDTTISAGTLTVSGTLADATDVINSGTYDVDTTDTIQSLSGSGAVELAGGITLTTGDSGNDTVSGIISGTGSLTKVGSGIFTFSANNTFTGDTTISAGTLKLTGTLSDSTDVINSGTYDVDATDTIQSLSGSGAVELAGGITLTTGDSGNDNISGVISGSGALTKAGSGTLTLSAINTYSGSTTLSAGAISISSSANLGATPGSADADNIIFNGGTLNTTETFTLGSNKGITLTGDGTINTDSSTTLTYGGVITGSSNLTKSGTGTFLLTGASTYTGDTIVSAGIFKVSGTLADTTDVINSGTYDVDLTDTIQSLSGSGAVELASGIILTTGDSGNDTVSGVISGAGSLTKVGSGTLTLSGTNTYTGDTTISAGKITVSGTLADTTDVINSGIYDVDSTDTIQSLSGSGGVELASSIILTTGDSGNDTVSGVISGSGSLTKAGTGILTLSGSNTFSGNTTISTGTLKLTGTLSDSTDVINSGIYDVDATDTIQSLSGTGAVELASSITLTTGDSGDDTVSGVISGTGSLAKAGSGTLTLSAINTYSGSTTLSAGAISISSSANLGATPGSADADNIIFNGGTLNTTGTFTLGTNKGITLTGNGTVNTDSSTTLTYGGIIAGSSNLTKSGSGALVLSGANTFSGDTTISAGTLTVSGTLSDSTDVINSGIYDVDATDTIQSLSGSGAVELASSITLTTGDSGDDTISGVISGAGLFTKSGSGTLTLSGENTYTGATSITAGTISIAADSGLGSSPSSATAGHLTLNGGTLNSSSTFTLSSNRGISLGGSNGTVDVNGSTTLTYAGIIKGSGSLTKSGLGRLVLSSSSSDYSGGTTVAAGTLSLEGSSSGSIGSASRGPVGTGSITVNSGATLDVNTTLIHNTKTNNGSIVNKPTPTFTFSNDSKSATYGDTGISADTLTENTNGTITYSSSNTSIATVNSSSGASASVAAGSTTITASGAETNEYNAASDSFTLVINTKTLTASASASNKTYDGGTSATVTLTFSGLIGSETLGQSVSATFSDKNVGTGKTVTVNSITLSNGSNGGLASNYSISSGQTTTANITAKAVTVSGIIASNKTYDATTSATVDVSSASFSGIVSGESLSVSASGVFDNSNVGSGKTVTLTSSYAGDDVNNYSITDQASTTANVTQKTLTATASASNKSYDATTTATVTLTFSGLIGSETLGQSVSATFSDKNVGTGKTVTVNSITLSDGSNGGVASNYSISSGQTSTADITTKALTVSGITGVNKTYDGSVGATLSTSGVTYSGLVSGDSFTVTPTGTFDNKNIGTGKTVTISSAYSGDDIDNYVITDQSSTTANITARSLTVSGLTASNKAYDASTTASISKTGAIYTGLVSGDDFTLTATGVFNNANVANGKTVTISSSYSGDDVSNYSITNQSSTTANIFAKALTATATASNKTYNGNTTATVTLSFSGLVGSQTLGQSVTAAFNNKNVGTGKTVTVSDITLSDGSNGGVASNYSISAGQTTTANITAKALSVSGITASNKTYDGNTNATTDVTSASYSGLVSGDNFVVSATGTFDNKNVGTGKTVTLSSSYSGSDVSNYSITDQASTTANITSKALTVSGITASDKSYDGSTSATLVTSNILYNGLVSGDSFTGSYTGTFDNKNVGTGKTVTISSSYSGDDVSNYSVTNQSSTTAAIVKKALTASASAANKTYNRNTTATTTLSFSGLVGSETLGQSVDSTFNNKNVGSGKTVTVNSITLSDGSNGGLASNYTISAGQTTTANITAKALTVSGITASNKTYDGNTVATLDLTGTSYSGLVSGDDLSISASGTFDNKNVGTGKTVNISASYSGSDVGNYSITDQSTTTANITASVSGITVRGITASNKTYDGNNSATLDTSNVSYSGLVEGDDVTGSFSGTFSNANAGSNKTVNISSSYSGADAGNYTITDQSTTTGNIIAKTLTATASASNKTYNGNTTANTTLTFSGLIGSETLGQSVTSSFNNKNVGIGKTVTISAITLSDGNNGGLASNYTISAGQTTTANISAKALTVSGITVSNKTYDGNTNATTNVTSASYSGLVSGDNFVVSATGTFDNKNIGTGKTVTLSSSYSGSDVSNYSVTNQSSTTANVTAKALTVSGITSSDKSYDGSTSATLGTSNILYTGLVNGDSFSGSYTGTFDNKNVGSGKTVTISSSYSGDDVSNYSITNQSSTTASIVKKSLTASASASNKTYNGNATATTSLTFSGLVGSETLAQSVSSTFNNKNVGTGKTVTVNSITLSDGSNGGLASNYTISAGQTTTANITGKSLSVSGITAPNKTYDGNTNAPLDISNISYSGLVSGDDIGGSFSGAFDNKNIGTSKTVSISASYSGVDSGNYTVTDQSSTTANITARTLTVSGLTASNKSYDATTSATLDTSNVSYAGLVSGDSFSGSYTGTFNNANVGTSKLVTISSSYSGDDINNYSITDQSSTGADITKASPTISGLSAQSKYSDESYTLAGIPSISGLSIAYSSSNTSIASVGSSTGAVSILSTGTSTITASIAATSNYNAASATYILTVSTRPTSNGAPIQVATYTAIRSMNENVSNSSGNISIRGSNGNLNNTSISGSSISVGKNSVISSKAKVIVLRPNLVPATEGIYEFSNNEDENRLKPPEKNNESFQKLGEIIGIVDYLVQIESENKTYNYNLEVRDGGILIKPKNLDSFSFAEFNKSVVIDKAMGAVKENFGIPTFQIKTIVIDLLSNVASN